jgi:hypothetical protein
MNPTKACSALRTQMGVEAFKLKYGTNHNKANAFGKYVSSMAHMNSDAARKDAVQEISKTPESCTEFHGKGKANGRGSKHDALRKCLVKAG